jgi:O-antigen/teichoic acid export membrane protein
VPRSLTFRFQALRTNILFGPAATLFISANIANAANLVFNMVFARIMGPAAFADLTLLLTLKLGILSFLGALQFAFAELTAKEGKIHQSRQRAKAISWRSLKFSIPIMFIVIALANYISGTLNFSSPLALCVLALAIPFFLPMVIYRGFTQGLIDLPKIIFSFQAEWLIRLFGSLLLWRMGFGLAGIAAAVGLSILAGLFCSMRKEDVKPLRPRKGPALDPQTRALGVVAVPYLILQMAQVLVLDSDILIAKASSSPETAGLVAGLLLIQRVFFFAFLSCSTILQPLVAAKKDVQKSPNELLMLLGAISIITMCSIVIILPNSDLIVRIMLGGEYLALSSIVWISALTGAVFIGSHLCAIYQIAKGKSFSAVVVLGFGVIQFISLSLVNHFFPEIGLHTYFRLKLLIQIACAATLIGIILMPSKIERLIS